MEDGNTSNASATKDEPMTISAPPAAPVIIDPQNPLPEASFAWRRILTVAISAALLGIAWHNAIQLHDLGVSADLLSFAKWCIALNGFVLLCYFIGPSAAELTSLVQTAGIMRKSLDVAETAAKSAAPAPQPAQSAQFQPPASPDSQIPASAPGEAYRPPSDDLTDLDQDVAPTSRA